MDFKKLFKGLYQTLKNPQIWLNSLVGLLLFLSLTAFAESWGISYLQQAKGLSKTVAVQANALVFLGWAVGGPFWGWFSDFIRRRCLPLTIGGIGSLIMISMVLYVPHLSTNAIYLSLFIFGFFSSVQILVFAICHEASKIKIAGTAIALTNMVVMLGGMVFPTVIGKLLDLGWMGALSHGARLYSVPAYQMSLSIIPFCIFIAIIVTFFIKETHCSMKSAVSISAKANEK